jgi:hypothetical protein
MKLGKAFTWFLTMVLIVALLWSVRLYVQFTSESFSDLYLGTTTKSFDAQRDMRPGYEFLATKTKCISCQNELLRTYGPEAATLLGGSEKCFGCLKQMASPCGASATHFGIATAIR